MEISHRAKLICKLLSDFYKKSNLKRHTKEKSKGKSELDKTFRYPEHLHSTIYELKKNFLMEFLEWNDSENHRVILQLHGGGYVGNLKSAYRTMAGLYSEVSKGASVLTLDYRVAPENPYPAALEDAIAAFDWLIESGFHEDEIIVAGDSAGGGLALALCHYLRDSNRKMPLGVVVMSPWADLTNSGSSYEENFEIDPLFGNTKDSLLYDNPYIGDNDPTMPYISPMFGDFTGFPPMLIQVGTQEMLLSDSKTVAKKAKSAGVKVKLSVYEGMFHVFQMAATLMPESKKAWSEVGKFIAAL